MHAYANPTRFLAIAKPLTPWLLGVGLLLVIGGAWAGLMMVPGEAKQGETARILYVHVPSAWLGMGGWTSLALAGLVQLVWRHPLAGIAARAIAVPGMLFCALCLATGSIWGRPTWGTWWVWDARLTSELILLFLYLGYMALVESIDDVRRADHAGALLALIGAINVPIIYFSVKWWNTLHQGATISMTAAPKMAATMLNAMLLMTIAFWAYSFAVVFMRTRAIVLERERQAQWVIDLAAREAKEVK
jgi:heme exporter protein C